MHLLINEFLTLCHVLATASEADNLPAGRELSLVFSLTPLDWLYVHHVAEVLPDLLDEEVLGVALGLWERRVENVEGRRDGHVFSLHEHFQGQGCDCFASILLLLGDHVDKKVFTHDSEVISGSKELDLQEGEVGGLGPEPEGVQPGLRLGGLRSH